MLRLEAVLLELSPNEISARDLQFLAVGVAGEGNDFHAVAHRFRDAFNVVGRGDENDLREIERHIEVTIDKGVVLPRIEHFEQRARRIAAEIGADLVDLVQHHDRIAGSGAAQFLDNPAGHRADVSPAMAADFRFVANPAEAHPNELPPERVGDRLPEARFAHAGRAEETKNRAVPLRIEFAHGEIFDQPPLHFFEVVMIAIENLLRLVEIEIVVAHFRPGQLRDRFDIGDDDRIIRARRRNEIEPLQFPLRLFHHLFRRLRVLQLFAQLRHLLFRAGIAFAQFLLDGLYLLAQVGPALRVGELRLHILLQLLLDLRDLELRRDARLHAANSFLEVVFLEQRLFLRDIDVQIRRQEIGQLFGILHPEDDRARLLGHVRGQLEQLRRRITQVAKSGFEFLRRRRGLQGKELDFRAQERIRLQDFADRKTPQRLHDDDDAIIRLAQ